MNTDFWTSVWLSVAIGVFVGYSITEMQISKSEQDIEMTPVRPSMRVTFEDTAGTKVEETASNPGTAQTFITAADEVHSQVVGDMHGPGDADVGDQASKATSAGHSVTLELTSQPNA